MTNQQKQKAVSVVGFCGGGVFLLLNIMTGAVPGGFVGGVLGFLIFGGIAAFVLYVLMPKDQGSGSTDSDTKTGMDQKEK
jgi:uncharacterized membrane protein